MTWVVAHWGLISVIAVAVISEALPFLPGNAQGIAHGVIELLGGKKSAASSPPDASQR